MIKLRTNYLFLFLFFPFGLSLFGQTNTTINGIVLDKNTKEKLPYASVSLKNNPIGTVSNANGEFQFLVPSNIKHDSLVVNYIGYEQFIIELDAIRKDLKIKLQPKSINLQEVRVYPLSPKDYLKRAVLSIEENYDTASFQTISYYREEIKENNKLLLGNEAVFKTCFSALADTNPNQHQVLLHRVPDSIYNFQFMRTWLEKKGVFEDTAFKEDEVLNNLGGPEMILESDLKKGLPNYIDTNQFKHFKYSFGEKTIYQGKELLTIYFKSKGKVDDLKLNGSILLEEKTCAIVAVNSQGKVVIPIAIRPVLVAFGLKVTNPFYNQSVNYEYYKGKWYPKYFYFDAKATLTKRHIAKAKEYSEFGLEQVLFVNKLETNKVSALKKEKEFNPEVSMADQVYNDDNISWADINIIKD